jgi:hypothetical protein
MLCGDERMNGSFLAALGKSRLWRATYMVATWATMRPGLQITIRLL